jgi:hypothetical protein
VICVLADVCFGEDSVYIGNVRQPFSGGPTGKPMTQFYVLGSHLGDYHTYFLNMKPWHQGEAPRCPACDTYIGALPWLPPYRAEVVAPFGKLGDITSVGGDGMLVSERFRRAWEERQLKGITEFAPLERLRIRPPRLAKPGIVYYHIQPQMFGAAIDFEHSKFKYGGIITCSKCKSMPGFNGVIGFTIEQASWTGEDIFRPWGWTGTVIVTDRVRQLRDDYDLKNVELTPTEEYVSPPGYKMPVVKTPFT